MIYLDNAATTLRKPPQVIDAVVAAMGSFGNSARGTHEEALAASRVIYDTRCKLAALFGCKRPDHVAPGKSWRRCSTAPGRIMWPLPATPQRR